VGNCGDFSRIFREYLFAKKFNQIFFIELFFQFVFQKCQKIITKENHWYYGLFFTSKMLNANSKTFLNLEANSTHTLYLGL
jgi:hypothetical protein